MPSTVGKLSLKYDKSAYDSAPEVEAAIKAFFLTLKALSVEVEEVEVATKEIGSPRPRNGSTGEPV